MTIYPAKKPARSRKRSPKPIARTGRPRPVNRKRKASEFARCYGSKERVEWVKNKPCFLWICFECEGPMDNAHTISGGKGRKADAATIIPLCRKHHREYDEHRGHFRLAAWRKLAKVEAELVERAWRQVYLGAVA